MVCYSVRDDSKHCVYRGTHIEREQRSFTFGLSGLLATVAYG